MPNPGALNLITDISGVLVGHATDDKANTGVTVLRCEHAMKAAVDVRGGAPGTRETDVLAPENLVHEVQAVVLSGGSVFGLAAADGVAAELSHQGVGLHMTDSGPAIPIVPAAVLHDLGYAGDKNWGATPPYQQLGRDALGDARTKFALGTIGAGKGARAGTVAGGIGSASIDLGDGVVVGALAAVNSLGSALLADGETFHAWLFEQNGEFGNHSSAVISIASSSWRQSVVENRGAVNRLLASRGHPEPALPIALGADSLDFSVPYTAEELKAIMLDETNDEIMAQQRRQNIDKRQADKDLTAALREVPKQLQPSYFA